NVMRDTMLVNVSGLAGHWMAIDMNIEHLIRFLKALFNAKGVYANWDRLGNLSACIVQLQEIKTRVTRSLHTDYHGSTHAERDTSELVWRVADKAAELQLQVTVPDRNSSKPAKLVPDLRATGREKFASSSLATFNKRLDGLKNGYSVEGEADAMLPVSFAEIVTED
ncbi:hypothetical protein H0H92_005659, partial [Tricholoma furcatifolium]